MRSWPTINDVRVRGWVSQIIAVGTVVGIFYWLVSNTMHNLEVRRIASGFGFLDREAGLPLAESLITYTPADTYCRALLVGLLAIADAAYRYFSGKRMTTWQPSAR